LEANLINIENVFRPRVGSYVIATIEVYAENHGEVNTLMSDLGSYARNGRFPPSNATVNEAEIVGDPIVLPPTATEDEDEIDLSTIDFDPITGAPREMP
jgi:hypothetical protein